VKRQLSEASENQNFARMVIGWFFRKFSSGLSVPRRQLRRNLGVVSSADSKNVTTIILDVIADEQELQHVCNALIHSGGF
jgi:hypothetical protein